MKNTLIILICFISFSFQSFAQSTIRAEEIIEQINRGDDVKYENVKIEGVLDLTALDNRQEYKKGSSWFGGSTYKYESQVEVKIEFINCIFQDDVLAYYNENDDTYIAHFENDVIFRSCTFKNKSEFKYSEFQEKAVFISTIFEEDANFKYAEFSEGPDFSNCIFEEEANFKYAEFDDDRPSFARVKFDETANFKYAEFPDGVTFEKAVFNGTADFKYTKFSEPLNLDGVAFNGREDFKYTKIDGRSFTSYLLKRRN